MLVLSSTVCQYNAIYLSSAMHNMIMMTTSITIYTLYFTVTIHPNFQLVQLNFYLKNTIQYLPTLFLDPFMLIILPKVIFLSLRFIPDLSCLRCSAACFRHRLLALDLLATSTTDLHRRLVFEERSRLGSTLLHGMTKMTCFSVVVG